MDGNNLIRLNPTDLSHNYRNVELNEMHTPEYSLIITVHIFVWLSDSYVLSQPQYIRWEYCITVVCYVLDSSMIHDLQLYHKSLVLIIMNIYIL